MSAVADVPTDDRGRELAAAPAAPTRRGPRLTPSAQRELILVLLLLLCYGFFRQVPAWNEHSRYDLVVALVDDHTVRIDRYHENTGDKALYNGHYYSDKPPGAALLGVPVYAAMRGVAALAGAGQPSSGAVLHALAFVVCGIPTALLALLLLRFLRPLVGEGWALGLTVGYALGTIAFPFATMYFGHAASTCFLFAACYLLWRARQDGRAWRVVLAGISAGWAAITEFPVALGVVVLLGYALWLGRRQALLFVAGGGPLLIALLAYNLVAFDQPFRLGYQYATVFAEQNRRGVVSVVLPKPSTALDLLLAPRGLLRSSPWYALAPLGLWAVRRRSVRPEVIVCAALAAAFLTYNSGALNPFGGWTPGPRYLLPALPFAMVLVALAPRAFRPLVGVQLAYSVALCSIATATMPNAPEAVGDPLGDLWLPRLLARDLAETTAWLRWGLHGLQPLLVLAVAAAIAAVALYATTQRTVAAQRLVGVGAGLLVALLLTFSTPLDAGWAVNRARAVPEGRIDIAILDAGLTLVPGANGRPEVAPWAQLENRGGTVEERTMVIFSIYAPSGERTWAAWHGDVRWRRGERKRLGVEWSTAGAAPGDYQVSVAVMSADQRVTFASVENAGHIRVGP